MTYILNWTSLGLDWNNPKAQEAKYMETLRQAFLEKYQPHNTSSYASSFEPIRNYSKFLDNINSSNNIYDYNFCVKFDEALLYLLMFYSTSSLTNFTGLLETDIMDRSALGRSYQTWPNPTQNIPRGVTRLLDILNTKTWISPPRRSCIKANLWLKQRYDMLNILTQFVFFLCQGGAPNYSYKKEGYSRGCSTATEAWNTALSNFNSASWVLGSYTPVAYSSVYIDAYEQYGASLISMKGQSYTGFWVSGLDFDFIYNMAPMSYDYYVNAMPDVSGSPRPPNYEIEPTSYNFSEYSTQKKAGTFTFSGISDVSYFPRFRVPSVEFDLGTPHIPSTLPYPGSPYSEYIRYTEVRGCVVLNLPFRFSN